MPNDSPPAIRVFPDRAALARGAAEAFAEIVSAAVGARGRAAVALAGGSTPRETYEVLARPPFRDRVPWPALDIFFGDERMVPPTDPRSNVLMAREALLDQVPIDPTRVHAPRVDSGDMTGVSAEYAAWLTAIVPRGDAGWPRFELVLLGLGADGHTASLFPGDPALEEERAAVAAVSHAPDGLARITLTFPVLNAAAVVAFLVAGEEKAEAVHRVLDLGESLPAVQVRPAAGTVLWFMDRAAAARLQGRSAPRPEAGDR